MSARLAWAIFRAGGPPHEPGGLGRPRLLTSPGRYLETVGLGRHGRDDARAVLGQPDRTASTGEAEYWFYRVAADRDRPGYTYVFRDGVLADVLYGGGSPRQEGMSARRLQEDPDASGVRGL